MYIGALSVDGIHSLSLCLSNQFLVAYGQVMSNFPSTKAAVAQFLARCSIKLRTDIQERVLRSCAGLYQQLLADGEWSVCAEAMQSFVHFVQFFPYPLESIQVYFLSYPIYPQFSQVSLLRACYLLNVEVS